MTGCASSIVWLLASCGLLEPTEVPRDPAAPAPGVLWVTVEGASATAFTPWGGTDDRLDDLAAAGTTWLRAYGTSPQLQPNLATLFTGLPLARHGVLADGTHRLPDAVDTVFEQLRAEGWHTASSTGSLRTDARWGFHQGIDAVWTHDDLSPKRLDGLEVIGRAPVNREDAQALWLHLHADDLDGLPAFVDTWAEAHPEGWLFVVGVEGRTDGLRLDDDGLRLPLLTIGPGYPAGTTRDDVVGLMDLGASILDRMGLPHAGTPLLDGGSGVVPHESHGGRVALGSAVLHGFTDIDGRFVSGQYATWFGALGARIPPHGHVVTETHPAAERGRTLRNNESRRVPEAVWLTHHERRRLVIAAPLALADADAPAGSTDPRDHSERRAMVEGAVTALGLKRYAEVVRLTEDLEGAAARTHLRALAARGRADFDGAATTLEAAHTTSTGPTWAWHRAELAADRCRLDEATLWLDVALERASAPVGALALAHRAVSYGRVPDGLAQDAERLVASHPQHPLAAAYIDPTNTTMLPVRPASPLIASLRARADWLHGHAAEAIETQRAAVALDPMDCTARVALARWYLETGDVEPAHRLLAPVARASPDDPVIAALFEVAQLTEGQRHERRVDRIHNRP